MDETFSFINSLAPGLDITPKQEQWAMSYAYNEPGQSLPEYHPENTGPEIATGEPADVQLGATDSPDAIADLIQIMLSNMSQAPGTGRSPDNIGPALDKLLGNNATMKAKAQKDMYVGALMKTVAAASDFFNRAVGIAAGQRRNIYKAADIAAQNYQNQMDALDNQVLYIKHQLADRFNKTVETNIMHMAARNLRVTSGGVLEQTKNMAQEMTEDMRTAESNAELHKIAYRAGQKQAKESARYAEKQMWTQFLSSATKLGVAVASGGFTGEKWGDLYSGYKKGNDVLKAQKAGTLTAMYD